MIARFVLASGLFAAAGALSPAWAESSGSTNAWSLQDALGNPDGLTVSGSVRVRYEALGNQFRPGLDRNGDLVSLRTTLFAQYDTGPVRFGAEVMDSRAYDADAGSSVSNNEVNAVELIQGYVGFDLGGALGKGTQSSLDIGRFTMDLGSRRLAARNNFRNATNAFAGARFILKGRDKETLTLFYTLPLQRLPADKAGVLANRVEWDRESFDLSFWGGFLSKPKIAGRTNLDLYFFGLNEKDSPTLATRNRHIFTPGFRLYAEPVAGHADYELEAAYQFGDIRASTAANAAKLDVSAYFLHAAVGYQFKAPWSPRIAIEYDRASGDRPGGAYNRFDSLYGSRRSDFGPTSIYGPLGRSNISSPAVRLEAKPNRRWDAFTAYRPVWLESATDSLASTGVRDPAGRSGKFAGHQVEARVRYWVVPRLLRLDMGGAVLLNGRFLKDAPNANGFGDTRYAYSDLTLTF